jgi:putative membrane protein
MTVKSWTAISAFGSGTGRLQLPRSNYRPLAPLPSSDPFALFPSHMPQTLLKPALVLAQGEYGGIRGFIPGSRGSLMLDVVFLAMFVVVPVLLASIYLVKYQRNYAAHKVLQIVTATVLLVAVLLFELDMRLHDWTLLARGSPYFDPVHKWTSPAGIALLIHLAFAVPTLVLWIAVVVGALKNFSHPPAPGTHTRWHRQFGMIAAIGMVLTAVTGWLFYWMAFVATASG